MESNYEQLVKALRGRAQRENEWYEHGGDIINDSADAIEALQAEVEVREKRIVELELQIPKMEVQE